MSNEKLLPFGLFFEESSTNEVNFIKPIYDELQDISIFRDNNGNVFPFVEEFGNVNTKTATKTVEENSDEDDLPNSSISTRTLTEVHTEDTDSDSDQKPLFSFLMQTRTATFDQTEQSDEDDELRSKWSHNLNTKTDTRELNENSDSDNDE
jgi:hypothetical protein